MNFSEGTVKQMQPDICKSKEKSDPEKYILSHITQHVSIFAACIDLNTE